VALVKALANARRISPTSEQDDFETKRLAREE
jgi:hypothetical protein